MGNPEYHVTLEFGVGGEKIVVTDKETIKAIVPLRTSIKQSGEYEGWEKNGIQMKNPVLCTMATRETAEFVLHHLTSYESRAKKSGGATADQYPEANKMNIEQLKQVMLLGEFFQAKDFMNCIASVLGPKLKDLKAIDVIDGGYFTPSTNPYQDDPVIETFHLKLHPDEPVVPPVPGADDNGNGNVNGNGDANGDDDVIDVEN